MSLSKPYLSEFINIIELYASGATICLLSYSGVILDPDFNPTSGEINDSQMLCLNDSYVDIRIAMLLGQDVEYNESHSKSYSKWTPFIWQNPATFKFGWNRDSYRIATKFYSILNGAAFQHNVSKVIIHILCDGTSVHFIENDSLTSLSYSEFSSLYSRV